MVSRRGCFFVYPVYTQMGQDMNMQVDSMPHVQFIQYICYASPPWLSGKTDPVVEYNFTPLGRRIR